MNIRSDEYSHELRSTSEDRSALRPRKDDARRMYQPQMRQRIGECRKLTKMEVRELMGIVELRMVVAIGRHSVGVYLRARNALHGISTTMYIWMGISNRRVFLIHEMRDHYHHQFTTTTSRTRRTPFLRNPSRDDFLLVSWSWICPSRISGTAAITPANSAIRAFGCKATSCARLRCPGQQEHSFHGRGSVEVPPRASCAATRSKHFGKLNFNRVIVSHHEFSDLQRDILDETTGVTE